LTQAIGPITAISAAGGTIHVEASSRRFNVKTCSPAVSFLPATRTSLFAV
jgi:hypothetical protein